MSETTDLEVTRSGELEVAQLQGITEDGIEFLDGWLPANEMTPYTVVDSGRILVPAGELPGIVEQAKERGLTVAHEEVA